MKKCTACSQMRSRRSFTKSKSSRDGLSYWCRDCDLRKQQLRRRRNRRLYWCVGTIRNHQIAGFEIKFSRDWLLSLTEATKSCPLCGTKIVWNNQGGSRYDSPSLDRIDNQAVMTRSSVQIICHRCNAAKGKDTLRGYLRWLCSAAKVGRKVLAARRSRGEVES